MCKILLAGEESEMTSMFYRPTLKETGTMWDTWLYWHEGTYYLYYLARSDETWDNISLAASQDGVHWRERGVVLRKADDAVWMGTGATWASPDFQADRKFFMNFSEWRGEQQAIFFAESSDLVSWTRLAGRHEFKPDTRWYSLNKGPKSRWDCIFTAPRAGGGLYGYWTANPKMHGGFGFGESDDGITWRALEPPVIEPPVEECECGAVAKVGDKYYNMLGINGGMYTYVSQRPEGPFRRAARNAALLAAGGDVMHTYFARFFHSPNGLLVNHHSIGRDGRVYFGLLKRALVDDEATLRLGWWEGNDRLKERAVKVPQPATGGRGPRMIDAALPVEGGIMLEGAILLPEGARRPAGLYVETSPGEGTAVLIARGGAAEIGPMPADGGGFEAQSRVDREYAFGRSAHFRLVLERDLLEFYIDNILIQCYSLPEAATGRIGVLGAVTDLAARA